MDNTTTPNVDNGDAQTVASSDTTYTAIENTTSDLESSFSWKSQLGTDLMNAPTLQKFEDNKDGLVKAVESHLSLEKLLGHEKVPIPKSADDVEGHNRLAKALGVPDKAEGYGLSDPQMPKELTDSGMAFDKNKFAEVVHSFKLTPNQAKGLWKAYTDMSMEAYSKAIKDHQTSLQNVVNQLRSEWGDAYDTNVDLGQTVINKFAKDQDENDYLTSVMTKDPRAVRFLSRIGNQFAENKIGEFSYKRFSLTPDQAQVEWDSIVKDPKHPYNDPMANQEERARAIDYVNSLIAAVNKGKG
jgi:hypothetical protein